MKSKELDVQNNLKRLKDAVSLFESGDLHAKKICLRHAGLFDFAVARSNFGMMRKDMQKLFDDLSEYYLEHALDVFSENGYSLTEIQQEASSICCAYSFFNVLISGFNSQEKIDVFVSEYKSNDFYSALNCCLKEVSGFDVIYNGGSPSLADFYSNNVIKD